MQNKIQLYGSITSPYVRRIRLLLASESYEFINLDIFSEQGRQVLSQYNPTKKVPFIIDNEQIIFDSGVIYRYLCEQRQWPQLTWQQQNWLTLIDAANDSLVTLLLSKRSGFEIEQDKLVFNLQRDRVASTLFELDLAVEKGLFKAWDYLAICLYCLIDWIQFRHLVDLASYPNLVQFCQQNQMQAGVAETAPSDT